MCDRSHLSKKDLDAIEWHQLKQSAARLHALGPLPLAYFLAEIARGRDLSETLGRYALCLPSRCVPWAPTPLTRRQLPLSARLPTCRRRAAREKQTAGESPQRATGLILFLTSPRRDVPRGATPSESDSMKHENGPLRKPSLQEIAQALGGEISAGQVKAPGPGHSPQDRSLAVKLSGIDPAGYVVHSFAGDDPIKCKDYVRGKLGMPPWEPSRGNGHDRDPVVASYVYSDAHDKPHLRVQRTAAKRFWQQHFNGDGWEKGAPKERIPYRLPELLAADPSVPIYIVEGQKDADRLVHLLRGDHVQRRQQWQVAGFE